MNTLTGSAESIQMLKALGKSILSDAWGFTTVWGGTGTAKSHLLMAMVSAFCRNGVQAVYYNAVDLQDGMYKDVSEDAANMEFYRRVPVLAIDELDKFRFTDWSRPQLQGLIDHRYRAACAKRSVTLFASNKDPRAFGRDEWLPGDIQSRLADGRFKRQTDKGEIPAIYHVEGADMREFMVRA